MIPTAILAGLLVGRWWSVPIIGALWAGFVELDADGAFAAAFLLGAVNAAAGVGVHVLVRKVLFHRATYSLTVRGGATRQ